MIEQSKRLKLKGSEPWSSGNGRRFVLDEVVGLNPRTQYLMDIVHIDLVSKLYCFKLRKETSQAIL